MNCSEAERLFDAYLDGELSGSLRFEFDAHRLHCPMCQRKLAMMEACEHILVGDARSPVLSGDFADRVMAQVTIRSEQMRRSRHLKLYISAAIGLQAAGVALFFFVWKSGQDASATPPRTGLSTFVKWDPGAVDQAYKSGSKVDMIDLMRSAVGRLNADVLGLGKVAANWTLPESADLPGAESDVKNESLNASDPLTHHL